MPSTDGNTHPELTVEDQRLRLAALAALAARVKREDGQARKDLHTAMADGEGHTVWNPLDESEQLATVSRSKKTPVATVTDRAALEAWLREHYPEKLETVREVTAEGLEFLADAAPDLIAERTVVPDWAINEITTASAKAKAPVAPDGTTGVPGVDVARPPGSLSVRLSDDAERIVTDLIAAGRIDPRGTPLALDAAR